jgi:cysteine-rich repeat protein
MNFPKSVASILCAGLLLACGAPPDSGAGDELPQTPAAVCGDGIVNDGEACDDGNTVDGDGCDRVCLAELPAPGPGDFTNYGDDTRPTLKVGFGDPFGAVSCAADMASGTVLRSLSNADDAGQVILMPSANETYLIAMPDAADTGFLTMEVPDWGAKITIYAHYSSDIGISGGGFEPVGEREWTNDCAAEAGMTQQKFVFHEWGAFQMQVDSASVQAWVMAIHTNP